MKKSMLPLLACLLLALPIPSPAAEAPVELRPTRPQVPLLGEIRETRIPKSLFYEKVDPIINEEFLLTSGYVTTDDRPFGRVMDTKKKADAVTMDDIVFIDRGTGAGVKKGDRFYIYRRVGGVIDDKGRRVVTIVGTIEVTVATSSGATARVVRAFNEIQKGDFIIPEFSLYIPTMDEDRPLEEKEIEGTILAVSLENKAGSENDVIYISVGRNEGVKEGDVFEITKGSTDEMEGTLPGFSDIVGKAKVILVREETSTAIIIDSSNIISVGDKIRYIQER